MRSEIINEITSIVGPKNCKNQLMDLELYSYDSSPFKHKPDLVAFVSSAEEISAVVKVANKYKIPVTARGAGTCVCGAAVAIEGGIMLVCTMMNKILELDLVEETVLVEPGLVNLELQEYLKPHGYMFPPDPASQQASTLGGNIAVNAGGLKCLKYGVTKQYVKGLEMVLSDGSIVRTGALATCDGDGGPDPSGVFLGSEGTLSIITKALLRISLLPQDGRAILVVFDNLEKSGKAVSSIMASGMMPAIMEIMDHDMLMAIEDYLHLGFPRDAEAILLIEVDGLGPELDRQVDGIVEICRNIGASDIKTAQSPQERAQLWVARRSANGALGRIRPAYLSHDVTVPVSKLPHMLTAVQKIARDNDQLIVQVGHAGDGNVHPSLLYDPNNQEEYEKVLRISPEVVMAALSLGGTVSGEHGIGLEKIEFMAKEFSHDELELMSDLKQAFDPDNLINPGKILPDEYMPAKVETAR